MRVMEAVKAYAAELEQEALDKANHVPETLPGGLPMPTIRYRPPHTQVPKHDARDDARQLFFEALYHKRFEPVDAHVLSLAFADYYTEVLHTQRIPYKSGTYEPLDGSNQFCKKVTDLTHMFIRKLAAGEISSPISSPPDWDQWTSSVHAERNRRPKMEDRHIACHDLTLWADNNDDGSHKGTALFAVFDGHGGSEVASYAAAHFPPIFMEAGAKAEEKTMRTAFQLMDDRLSLRCEKENWRSGATAVVAAVDKKNLALAWCGDSALLIMRATTVERVSRRHVPSDPEENARVEAAGGVIVCVQGELRVNAVLNVTRSLGDVQGRPMIISEPDCVEIERGPGDYGLILACDGVSDELDDEDFFKHIKEFCTTKPVEAWRDLTAHLCSAAREVGSSDNLTCMFVFLRPPSDLWSLFAADE